MSSASSGDAPIAQALRFLLECDALKRVERQSPLLDGSRRENSAEHSWHVALYALVLRDYAEGHVDPDRVIRMLLLHDVVEVDAGDTPIHGAALHGQAEREEAAARRLFGLVPGADGQALYDLWREFEDAASDDARFAKALDRLQPLLTNVSTGGGTWNASGVTYTQVMERYGRVIAAGSPRLWAYAAGLVRRHFGVVDSEGR